MMQLMTPEDGLRPVQATPPSNLDALNKRAGIWFKSAA